MTPGTTPPDSPECRRIQDNAAALASLDDRDPERRAAIAHAATCQACQAALAEGTRLMGLLDAEARAMEPPSAWAMARASAEILASLDREADERGARPGGERAGDPRARRAGRVGASRWRDAIPSVAVVSATWLIAGLIRMAVAPAPSLSGANRTRAAAAMIMIASTAVGGAGVLLLGGWWLVGLFPGASLLMSLVDGGGAAHQAAIGLSCAGFEMAFALLSLGVAGLLVWRGIFAAPSAPSLAIAAGGGALVAQSVLHAICHAQPSTSHNLLFHTAPLILALLVGALFGRRVSLPR